MLPAHERLRAERGAGRDVDLRLVVQHELALIERGVEVVEHLEPQTVEVVELRVVDGDAGVGVLGGVHRDIGAPQQVDDEGAVVALGDARARAHDAAARRR